MMRVVRGFMVSVGVVVVRFLDVEWFGSGEVAADWGVCGWVSLNLTPQRWLAWSEVLN
jgi:hypothetical protein